MNEETEPNREEVYKLFKEMTGHSNSVSSVKFSPDGKWIATASADKTARLWHADDGVVEQALSGHTQGLNDLAWTSDSRFLATVSDDQTLRIFDVAEGGEALKTFRGHTGYVFCVGFNVQGNLVVTGSFDETVRLWDVRSGKCVRVLNAHADPITSVNFNRDGTLIATGSYDGLCRVWETENGTCLKTLVDEDNPPVGNVKFSPNGKYLLVGTLDNTLRLWNFEQSKCVGKYSGHKNEKFCISSTFCVTGSQHFVVSASEDQNVFLWNLHTRKVAQVLKGHTGTILGVDAHPSKQLIVSSSASPDTTVRLWKAEKSS